MLSLLLPAASGHSWVACTDYGQYIDQNTNPKATYDNAKCKSYPRGFLSTVNGDFTFGADKGYNYQGSGCNKPFAATPATQETANYQPGQSVCLAWPTKNHVAATCTNQYIPDNGLWIYMSAANPSADPSITDFQKNTLALNTSQHQNGVIDFKGYQNCPGFCDNMDKSLCTGCFTIPTTTPPGRYVFMWYWIFNQGAAAYISCWDANIGGSVITGNPIPPTEPPAPSTVTGSDTVKLAKYPNPIPLTGSFDVDVTYTASGSRQVLVDILWGGNWTWYGKGSAAVTATTAAKTITLKVTIETPIPQRTNYYLKPWIVDTAKLSDSAPWAYELSSQLVPVAVGTQSPSAAGRPAISALVLVAIALCFLA